MAVIVSEEGLTATKLGYPPPPPRWRGDDHSVRTGGSPFGSFRMTEGDGSQVAYGRLRRLTRS